MYAVTDLGTLGGDYAAAIALNRQGHVVGYSRIADGRMRAFRWAAAAVTRQSIRRRMVSDKVVP